MEISQNYGDFHNGIARVVEDEAIVYYDPKGVELKRFPEAKGTGFTDGYAFVTMPGGTYRINEDFDLSKIGDRYNDFYGVDNFKPSFPFYPVSIVHYNRTAIRPDGLALVYFSPGENLELRPFSADGYAYAETKYRGGIVRGYIRPDGSYTVILGVNADDNHAEVPVVRGLKSLRLSVIFLLCPPHLLKNGNTLPLRLPNILLPLWHLRLKEDR